MECGYPPDEPPEILRKVREAKDVRGALEKLDSGRDTHVLAAAAGHLQELVDIDALISRRELVPIHYDPPEDLSEGADPSPGP